MNFQESDVVKKQCTKCKTLKPRTAENFQPMPHNRYKDGFQSWCRECCRAYHRKKYYENPEKAREATRLWKKENTEKVQKYNQYYNETFPEKTSKSRKQWYDLHQDEMKAHARNRRARRIGAEGHYTTKDVERQGKSQNWKCYWQLAGCAVDCSKKYHVDHVIPLSRGGSNWPSNIVIACPHCNLSKHDKLPEELVHVSL